MQVRSSCPVRSSASSSIPTPSSTEAIIAARSRISSCVPAWIAASTACARSVALRRKASAQAGFARTTSSGGSTFGRGGNTRPR